MTTNTRACSCGLSLQVESFIKLMVEQAALSEHWEDDEQLRMLKRVRDAIHHALHPEEYRLNPLSGLEVLALDGIIEKKTEEEGLSLEEASPLCNFFCRVQCIHLHHRGHAQGHEDTSPEKLFKC